MEFFHLPPFIVEMGRMVIYVRFFRVSLSEKNGRNAFIRQGEIGWLSSILARGNCWVLLVRGCLGKVWCR